MSIRKELEAKIYAEADSLRAGTAGMSVIPIEQFEPYIDAWLSLELYYRDHADEDIGVFVVEEYLYWSLYLGVIAERAQDRQYKLDLEEVIVTLRGFLEDIIKYTFEHFDP